MIDPFVFTLLWHFHDTLDSSWLDTRRLEIHNIKIIMITMQHLIKFTVTDN